MPCFVRLALVALALSLGGCPAAHSIPPDASVPSDAAPASDAPASPLDVAVPLDANVDGGPSFGRECADDPEICDEGTSCFSGFCTTACGSEACPADWSCVHGLCQRDCDLAAIERPCPRGSGCGTRDFTDRAVCIGGGCWDDADCDTGERCDRTPDGGHCFTPEAPLGSACGSDRECGRGDACLAGVGWPHGACVRFWCDQAGDTGCSGDAHCVNESPPLFGAAACLDGCGSGSDCQPGYTCTRSAEGRPVCLPGCRLLADGTSPDCDGEHVCNPGLGLCVLPFTARLGASCDTKGEVGACGSGGGTCVGMPEGFTRGYCTYLGCRASGMPCPEDGVCVDGQGAYGLCLARCTSDADCAGAETRCLPDASGVLACRASRAEP